MEVAIKALELAQDLLRFMLPELLTPHFTIT